MPARSADQHPDLPAGYVRQAPGLGYFVKSRTSEGVWWLVAGNTCSCHAGRAERHCWHLTQVEAFCRALNVKHARPAAPANISALVD